LSPASTSTPAEAYVMGASLTRPAYRRHDHALPTVQRPLPTVGCIPRSQVTVEHIEREVVHRSTAVMALVHTGDLPG
jgi:hypothetical protein